MLSLPILLSSLKCPYFLSVSRKPVMHWLSADCLCDCPWVMVLLWRAAVCFFVLLNACMTWGESPKSPRVFSVTEFTSGLWLMFHWPKCCCLFSFRGPSSLGPQHKNYKHLYIFLFNQCLTAKVGTSWRVSVELLNNILSLLSFFRWLKAGLQQKSKLNKKLLSEHWKWNVTKWLY